MRVSKSVTRARFLTLFKIFNARLPLQPPAPAQPPHFKEDPPPFGRGQTARASRRLDDPNTVIPYRDAPRGDEARQAAPRINRRHAWGCNHHPRSTAGKSGSIERRGVKVCPFPETPEGAGRAIPGPWRDFQRMAGALPCPSMEKPPVGGLVQQTPRRDAPGLRLR